MDTIVPQLGYLYAEHGDAIISRISKDPEFIELAKAEALLISEDIIREEMRQNPKKYKRSLDRFDENTELLKKRRNELADKLITADRASSIEDIIAELAEREAIESLDSAIQSYENSYTSAFPPTKTELMNLGVYKTEDFVTTGHKGIVEDICLYCVENTSSCTCLCIDCNNQRNQCRCVDFTTDSTLKTCLDNMRIDRNHVNTQNYFSAVVGVVRKNKVLIMKALKSCPETNIVCPICFRTMKSPGRFCRNCRLSKTD